MYKYGQKWYGYLSADCSVDSQPCQENRSPGFDGFHLLCEQVETPRLPTTSGYLSRDQVPSIRMSGEVQNALAENGSWVVGPDQGPTPPNLSSRSLFQWRRERERESLVYAIFFCKYNPL